jgi:hypothetical protein
LTLTCGKGQASIQLTTNGAERMRIDSSGNVGIGTSSPLQKLHVEGLSYFGSDIFTLNNGGIFFSGNNSYQRGIYSNASGLTLQTLGSPKVTITDGGNVGIGTTAPSGKFEIDASGSFNWGFPSTAVAKIGTKGTGGSLLVSTPSLNSSYESGFAVDGTYSSGKSVINLTAFGVLSGGPYGADFAFRTTDQSVLSERMRITSGGNVGIGTSSPSGKLEVNGSGFTAGLINATMTSGGGNVLRLNTNFSGGNTIDLNPFINGVSNGGFEISQNGTQRFVIAENGNVGIGTTSPGFATAGRTVLTLNGSSTSLMEFQAGGAFKSYFYQSGTSFEIYETNTLQFSVNGGERMRIDLYGNVGIGTSSPQSKLSIGSNHGTLISIGQPLWSNTAVLKTDWDGSDFTQLLVASNAANSAAITLRASGNVGIGTSNPSGKLDTNGDGVFGKQDYSYQAIQKVLTLRGDAVSGVYAGNSYRFYTTPGALNSAQKLSIRSEYNGSESSDLMTILGNGNVGIGTASPGAKLVVYSGASVTDYASFATGDGSNTMQYIPYVGAGDYNSLSYGGGSLLFNTLGSRFTVGTHNGTSIQFGPTNTLILGNVGIGTTAPIHKLSVNGKIGGDVYADSFVELQHH